MMILNLAIIGLLLIFLILYIEFEHKSVGLNKPIFALPSQYMILLEVLPWIILSLFTLDLYLKYRKVKVFRRFISIYWLDIIMTILFPIFGIFKIIKLAAGVYKAIKITKIGKTAIKIILGTKKIFKE